jgi:hypothetical protein
MRNKKKRPRNAVRGKEGREELNEASPSSAGASNASPIADKPPTSCNSCRCLLLAAAIVLEAAWIVLLIFLVTMR